MRKNRYKIRRFPLVYLTSGLREAYQWKSPSVKMLRVPQAKRTCHPSMVSGGHGHFDNARKAFMALESLVVLLILIVLLFYIIQTINEITSRNNQYLQEQQRFDKLVSIADHVVKVGAARETNDARYPNWIDESKLGGLEDYYKDLLSLSTLSIDFAQDEGVCIYRLVVVGDPKEIRKLFVCGE